MYDAVIVGAGLTGCTIARAMTDAGKKVLVIERDHIGGNCRTEIRDGIECHIHGPHTWHNDDPKIQQFIDRFAVFRPYSHRKFVSYHNTFFPFPLNLESIRSLGYDITTDELMYRIDNADTGSFESYLISILGYEMYSIFYKTYSLKQWGTLDIPVDIARRIPIQISNSYNYFHDFYQAQPENYNALFNAMLAGIEYREDDYVLHHTYFENSAPVIIYTGSLDEYFHYDDGYLSYRTITHDIQLLPMNYYQPCGTLNFVDDTSYVRSVEFKHFNQHRLDTGTYVSFEYVSQWQPGNIRYYPMWDHKLYASYLNRMPSKVLPAGRLGRYRYLDMNTAVGDALVLVQQIL